LEVRSISMYKLFLTLNSGIFNFWDIYVIRVWLSFTLNLSSLQRNDTSDAI
jgi:hypothetical protein